MIYVLVAFTVAFILASALHAAISNQILRKEILAVLHARNGWTKPYEIARAIGESRYSTYLERHKIASHHKMLPSHYFDPSIGVMYQQLDWLAKKGQLEKRERNPLFDEAEWRRGAIVVEWRHLAST